MTARLMWTFLNLRARLLALLKDDEGQDLAEYALIIGAVLAVVAALVYMFGGRVAELWQRAIQSLR